MSDRQITVTDIEVVEDFSSTARCDEGFLQLRRLRCRNRRADGSSSPVYRVDVIDRPRLDAVAVVIYRRAGERLEVLTRMNLRPAAYFRKEKTPTLPDAEPYLHVEEIVAGLLEPTDSGEDGIRRRASEEVKEEAGIAVEPSEVRLLGAGFFVAPGILSEKIYLTAVDVTGLQQGSLEGDGSPLEEGARTRWWEANEAVAACRDGRIVDAKSELGWQRLLASL
ncbi:MAG: NUDIX hydrolase [Myxococcaceae bacterium]